MYGLILAELGPSANGAPTDLLERGQLRLLGPRSEGAVSAYTLVNTGGAVLGGDRLRVDLAVRGAQAHVGTVGATLLHAGRPSFARTRLRVGAGASLEWRPGPLLPMAGSQHRQHMSIDVAAGGLLLVTELLQAGPLCTGGAGATRLDMTISARYGGRTVYRERTAYTSANALCWAEFRCLGTILALGEPFDATLAGELSERRQSHCLWGAFSTLVAGGISGKLLARHPQDCREAMAAAIERLRQAVDAC